MTGVVAGAGGGNKAAGATLRLHHYLVMAGVAAAFVLACLRYAPDPAGYGFLAVAPRPVEADAGARRDTTPPPRPSSSSSSVVIFNFGDSNSDTGGMAAVNGMNINLPEGRTFFRRPTGRLSDGRLVIDFICESLHTPFLSPYLKALGADFSNGVNFAIGGSTATPGGSPFSLDVQLHQWLYFRARSMEMINLGQRPPIDREGFRKAIYTIDIGQNDVSAYMHLPYDQVLAKIPGFVAQIKYTIETLYSHGARKFWIHGTGALGCLPQKLAIPRDADDGDQLDAHGCLKTYNNAAKRFNALLGDACAQLRRRMVDAALVFVDMYAVKYDLVANHTTHGIEKPLMACCGYGGPPYNYNHFKACMSAEMQLCDVGTRFISWDGVHFTEAANAIVAAKVLTGDYSTPRVTIAKLVNSTLPNDD
ncbi:alpha-L-fucosidase 2 [Zea mays]|uniref:GDSL esterase/lipase LIP-4 n=1 Tax=Zea mays TaxID=4577 RepID=C0PDY5_MAIZE|nr:alpha-L-fucosidase 2 [Zea mays]ACN33401.1 unknown [Zea mays]ONM31889.1 GDSL esterase/lipase LIP-4 [Zea mays]ONM31891.1 GDSL esterase/lipase LIP-4 [Zea mays]